MDPQAALQRIIDAVKIEDVVEARVEFAEACDDLADWLRRGGFAPVVPAGTKYIPGTGTLWALFPPDWALFSPGWKMYFPSDRFLTWTLRRYSYNGDRLEVFALKGDAPCRPS